jgi:hypothetical protein
MGRTTSRVVAQHVLTDHLPAAVLAATVLLTTVSALGQSNPVGVNVVLTDVVADVEIDELGRHGKVLNVFSEINAVTMKVPKSVCEKPV